MLKTLSLLLMMFVLGTVFSGCTNHNDVSSTDSKSTASQIVAGESSRISAEEIEIPSDAASRSENSDQSAVQQSSSGKTSSQSSSSEQTALQQSTYNTTSKKEGHTHEWKTQTVEASCLGAGYVKKTCDCGESQSTSIEALGHKWSGWKTTLKPTATSEGERVKSCLTCGAESVQSIDKLTSSESQSDARQEVLRLVNAERKKQGLSELNYYSAGQAAADLRADEIKTSFSHTRPDGRTCFTVFEDFDLGAFMCGENIAWGQRSAQEVVNSWMNSDGHRKNILNPNATGIVVGVKDNHWVQLFVTE